MIWIMMEKFDRKSAYDCGILRCWVQFAENVPQLCGNYNLIELHQQVECEVVEECIFYESFCTMVLNDLGLS